MFLVEDKELSHDAIDVDVKGVIRPPVVVKDLERKCESLLSLLELASHVFCLHENTLELDSFGMHQQLSIFEFIYRSFSHLVSCLPLAVL